MVTVHFDGSCFPVNPGGRCGGGAVIRDLATGEKYEISDEYIPEPGWTTSNNAGEHYGLLIALQFLLVLRKNKEQIEVFGDSQMIINQASRYWRIKPTSIYYPVGALVLNALQAFPDIRFHWIPREENEEADFLSKRI
jgi:ribonuclease HI